MRAYRFQLCPNKQQETLLFTTLRHCRFTYNQLLEFVNSQQEKNHTKTSHHILKLKEFYPELKATFSKALQYESDKLFRNIRGLAQLEKHGVEVGKLRFKGIQWFNSFTYNQSGFKLIARSCRYNLLRLSKIGEIRIRQHREMEGTIKQITIKRTVRGWQAIIITDAKYTLPKGENILAFDLGIKDFLTTQTGEKIDNPLFLQKSLKKVQDAHRCISRTTKGSKNRYKARKILQRRQEKISYQRTDFFHKLTTKLVRSSHCIIHEDLHIAAMIQKKDYCNKRNMGDSCFGTFLSMLRCKAESAGIDLIAVDPYNTSKQCSGCGAVKDMPLSQRTYGCPVCGLSLDRDHNAAINILNRGLGTRPCGDRQGSINEARSHFLNC